MGINMTENNWLTDEDIAGDLLGFMNATRNIQSDIRRRKPLPKYLKNALLRYQSALWKERAYTLIVPKLIDRHHKAGKPKTTDNAAGDVTAYEAAAKQLGVSAKTIQRIDTQLRKTLGEQEYSFLLDPPED